MTEGAYNGKEAIEKILQFQENEQFFKIVLIDVNMPIMDGLEATAVIRQMIEDQEISKDLAIIVNTAFTSEEDKKASL